MTTREFIEEAHECLMIRTVFVKERLSSALYRLDKLDGLVTELRRLLSYVKCDGCGRFYKDMRPSSCIDAHHVEAEAALKDNEVIR